MREHKFSCSICNKSCKAKNNRFKHHCNNRICLDCIIKNVFEYNDYKCPYCRVDIILQLSRIEGLYLNRFKMFVPTMYKNLFKCDNNTDLISRIATTNLIRCRPDLQEDFKKIIPDHLATFVETLRKFKPFILSINKGYNMLLTDGKYVQAIIDNTNFKSLCNDYNINEIGIFINGNAEQISMMHFNETPTKFIETYKLLSVNITPLHDKINNIDVNEKIAKNMAACAKYITTLKIINESTQDDFCNHIDNLNENNPITIEDHIIFMTVIIDAFNNNVINRGDLMDIHRLTLRNITTFNLCSIELHTIVSNIHTFLNKKNNLIRQIL